MRVCYLSSNLGVHDQRFLSKLVERGYETYLVTYSGDSVPSTITGTAGLKVIHRRPRCLKRLQKYLSATKVLDFATILREIKPDIVHSGYVWKDGFLAALSGFHPHLLMPWGSDILTQPDEFWICRWITQYTIRRADRIACDCEEVKKKIVRLAGYPEDRIVVFPWGLELDKFRPMPDGDALRERLGWKDKKVVVMNRAFKPVYGIPYFINALPRIIGEDRDVRVLLIGSGPMERDIRMLVHNNQLEDFVVCLGAVPVQDMPLYLNAADIYVSSSLSDGTSMSLLEAMACGLPVVVTDVPAILEWVDNGYNGYVVPRRDSEALAVKILELLRDQPLREKMSERNLSIAREQADWEKNFRKLERMYDMLVAGMPAG